MATYTENLNLKKPGETDFVDIADMNENMDAIDYAIASNEQKIAEIEKSAKTANDTANNAIPKSQINAAGGVAGLDVNRKVSVEKLPVDEIKKLLHLPIIATGHVLITTDEGNTPKAQHVDFPEGLFTAIPCVFVNPKTAVPGTKVLGISVTNLTKTGCDIYITRTAAEQTGICWLAVQV